MKTNLRIKQKMPIATKKLKTPKLLNEELIGKLKKDRGNCRKKCKEKFTDININAKYCL